MTSSMYKYIYSLNVFSSYIWILKIFFTTFASTISVLIYKIAFVCSHICIFPKYPNKSFVQLILYSDIKQEI